MNMKYNINSSNKKKDRRKFILLLFGIFTELIFSSVRSSLESLQTYALKRRGRFDESCAQKCD